MNENLGLVSISFRGHTPQEILAAVRACGLKCIEWGSDVHAPAEQAAQIGALTKQYGITCCSYGTYFRLGTTPLEELHPYIAAARHLGTRILRLWCGSKNSEDYTLQEREELFRICREAARIAEKADVVLCMECHNNTFTNTKEAAYMLMQAVASGHFQMYWQPNQFRSLEENLAYARQLAPYTHVIHVFNWEGNEKYPLAEAIPLWKRYLACFPENIPCLLEFMPDNRLESLEKEAQALKEIANG